MRTRLYGAWYWIWYAFNTDPVTYARAKRLHAFMNGKRA